MCEGTVWTPSNPLGDRDVHPAHQDLFGNVKYRCANQDLFNEWGGRVESECGKLLRHTDIGWDFDGKFNYSVTMELIISHHWRLPKSVLIPVLQNRLAHCFQKGCSQSVDISSVDWLSVYGDCLPIGILDWISQHEQIDLLHVEHIRLGNQGVFQALQKDWYVQKGMLFLSNDISSTDLDFAIQFWLHERELKRVQSNVE